MGFQMMYKSSNREILSKVMIETFSNGARNDLAFSVNPSDDWP
jgi:hypothetical protein